MKQDANDMDHGLLAGMAAQKTRERDYWLRKLSGELKKTTFFPDRRDRKPSQYGLDYYKFSLNGSLCQRVLEISAGSDLKIFVILTTFLVSLLHKYTGDKDIILGVPVLRQARDNLLINRIISLRIAVEGAENFKTLLGRVLHTIREATDNQNYPFEILLRQLFKGAMDRERNQQPPIDCPLFGVTVLLDNIHERDYLSFIGTDINFFFSREGNGIRGEIGYNTALYRASTIERIAAHFSRLASAQTDFPDAPLTEPSILGGEDKKMILWAFNKTGALYPGPGNIHDLVQEKARQLPDHIAVVGENGHLSYSEMTLQVDVLAGILRCGGVVSKVIVGILAERSSAMVIGMMAVLRAGGAYLPLDPKYPEKRLNYMLTDCDVRCLLARPLLSTAIGFEGKIVPLDPGKTTAALPELFPGFHREEHIAYVIYTSGSTGRPRGVAVEHRAVTNTLCWRREYYGFNTRDIVLQVPTFAFDSSVEDIFTSLISGCRMIMMRSERPFEPDYLAEVIEKHGVTHFLVVPHLYRVLLEEIPGSLKTLEKVTVAGDHFSRTLVERHFSVLPLVKLYNEYGPTENSVCSTVHLFEPDNTAVLIGRPIANVSCYILGSGEKVRPLGVPGELWVAGPGIARGYLNRIETTGRRFCDHPFLPGKKAYKTGDMARWDADGNIEFLGRLDNQVKLRGFRIELEEIEGRLVNHERIAGAAVTLNRNQNSLAAYIVSVEAVTDMELRNHLAADLPDYMIPTDWIRIDRIPLSPNGKIDRNALSSIHPIDEAKREEPPEFKDKTEKKMARLWAEVLGVPESRINAGTNFFKMGGHSLKAISLASKIHREFETRLPVGELFKLQCLRQVVDYVKAKSSEVGDRYIPIAPVEKRKYYPLSSAQKRMVVLQRMDPNSTVYNMPEAVFLNTDFHGAGNESRCRLQNLFDRLIERHESLRTSFIYVDDQPVQLVHREVEFNIEWYGGRENPGRHFIRPFDLSRASLLRVGVSETGDKSLLLVDIHHAVCDGISMEVLIREFFALSEGGDLPELTLQYKDYACWQNRRSGGEIIRSQQKYWLEQFFDDIPVLNLPLDFSRPAVQDFTGDMVNFELGLEETAALRRLSAQSEATLFMVLTAVFFVLLARLTGQSDIVVGIPVACRRHSDLERIIGMFVNTLPLRNYPGSERKFIDLIGEVRQRMLAAFENQEYPFEDMVEKLVTQRDAGRNPLFDVMMVLQNLEEDSGDGRKSYIGEPDDADRMALTEGVSRFDMTWIGFEKDERILMSVEYCSRLFKAGTIHRFIGFFLRIVRSVVKEPAVRSDRIQLLSMGERKKILDEFNDSYSPFPSHMTISQLFEQEVKRSPHSLAVVFEDQNISYLELVNRSNRLVSLLTDRGVESGCLVGIEMESSVNMVISLLAVLKTGSAYMPINIDYPEKRKAFMLKESVVHTVLEDRVLNEMAQSCSPVSPYQRREEPDPSSPAYVIYTSGTTGLPKGVVVEHRGVVRLVKNTNYVKFERNGRLLQTGALEFDASTFEIWGALLNGLTLYPVEQEKIVLAVKLKWTIRRYGITIMWLTSSLFNHLVDSDIMLFSGLAYLLVGGEVLSPVHMNALVRRFPRLKIINGYGPTENTTFSTTFPVDGGYEHRIPIGKPIANSTAYVVGKAGAIQPVGIEGELWVGGDGVARGYLNNPELTAKKFVPDRFRASGSRIYRTGDLCRWLPSGDLDFVGRRDTQVKIRGFRIEPAEIEIRLCRHPGIREAVVICREDRGSEKYLAAYLVPSKPGKMPLSQLKGFLSESLPDYMVPSCFVRLEKLPLTASGKLDRRALPEPRKDVSGSHAKPADEIERKLVAIWAEVLSLEYEQIQTTADFFQLGGHSLRATLILGRIHRTLNVEVPLAEIFKNPTIRGLADYIRGAQEKNFVSIPAAEKRDYHVLSPAQRRIYILQQMDPGSTVYNIPQVVPLTVEIHQPKMEEIIKKLVYRHEILRTSFVMIASEPVQRVNETFEIEIEILDRKNINGFIRPFDLSRAPLFRVGRSTLGNRPCMILDIHHIIGDGFSMELLIAEFLSILEGEALPALRLRYRDYAQWLQGPAAKSVSARQESFWIQEFSDGIPVLHLPYDLPRPAVQSFEGGVVYFEIEEEGAARLNDLARQRGTTLFMVLLSLFYILLSRLSGQDDLVVGTPVAGRPHSDLEKIIGMFVNSLALRNQVSPEMNFMGFLDDVKDKVIRAFENQEYPFEELVEKVVSRRDAGRNPIFDVMLVLQNIPVGGAAGRDVPGDGGSEENMLAAAEKVSRIDMTWIGFENNGRIVFAIEYCTRLFKYRTVVRFSDFFIRLVHHLETGRDFRLHEPDMISPEERKRILSDFNATATPFPSHRSIVQLFDSTAGRFPHVSAAVSEAEWISYKELKIRSIRLARRLESRGMRLGAVVGITVGRSIGMVVGLLAVLRGGGVYLPINPDYPAPRKKFILRDSGAEIILTRHLLSRLNPPVSGKVENERSVEVGPGHPAYIIYTSGTTGRPKGVLTEHRGVVRLVKKTNYVRFERGRRLLQTGALEFDASTFEIWGALLNGLTLCMAGRENIIQPEKLKRTIRRYGVTIMFLTTSLFNHMVDSDITLFSRLAYLLVGGEVLSPVHINTLNRRFPMLMITNCYGPTENTSFSTTFPVDGGCEHRIPIGKPIANSTAYVVGKTGAVQPLGIEGELWVGGDGVARGYLNNPEATAEKFIPFRFRVSGSRLYRTGDLCRWLPSGDLDFIGRRDTQVKIRGFRIEPGEIENRICRHPGISETVVICRTDGNSEKYLVAYVVTGSAPSPVDSEMMNSELRHFLAASLPDYMIPRFFVPLAAIPLTANGKVDIQSLPSPQIGLRPDYTAPSGPIETALAALWSGILSIKRETIGVDSDFFEIGGHSLHATRMISGIQGHLKVSVPLVEIFKGPTIRQLAAYIESMRESSQFREDENIVRLSTGDSSKRNVFFIHDGTGEVEGYVRLCGFMTSSINCWGFRADRLKHFAPRESSVESMSSAYVEKMKKVQPKGPYNIVGWSMGGSIAFDMVRRLEAEGSEIGFLCIIDAPAPGQDDRSDGVPFSVESELSYIKEQMDGGIIGGTESDYADLESLWSGIATILERDRFPVDRVKSKIGEQGLHVLPNFSRMNIQESIYYLNMVRSLSRSRALYSPAARIHSPVIFIKAGDSPAAYADGWRRYCHRPLRVTEIPGDHFTILQSEAAPRLAEILERFITEQEVIE